MVMPTTTDVSRHFGTLSLTHSSIKDYLCNICRSHGTWRITWWKVQGYLRQDTAN